MAAVLQGMRVRAPWHSFLRRAAAAFVVSLAVMVASAIGLFWRAGEYWSIGRILDDQARHGGLYRTVSIDAVMSPDQRLARLRLLAPEIVALGSSRVLQFRAGHFRRRFVNMGMSFDLVFFRDIARAMVTPPFELNVVILSLDHWQFYPATQGWVTKQIRGVVGPGVVQSLRAVRNGFTQYASAPLHLLMSGRLTFYDLIALWCRCDPVSGARNDNIGIAAQLDGTGVDREGSLHYDWVYQPSQAHGFASTLDRVAAGTAGFEFADRADDERFRLLTEGLKIFDAAGVKVVLLIPPVAGAVAEAMERSGRYGIVKDLSRRLREHGRPFFDFHDPRRFGSSDCEFADGMHGGEVTALRMLRIMAGEPHTGLSEWVDVPRIDALIARYSGRVNAYDVPRSGDRSRREIDFLGLGCAKAG